MDKSKISWTHATWNFVVGCSKVSPGCTNCYAERLALRYGWSKKPWTAPNARENVIIKPNKLTLPLKWKEPRRIFVNSLSDLFHEQVPDEVIDRAFAVMALCPQHTFQILTKRPKRMLEYFAAGDELWLERWVMPQVEFVGESEPTVFPLKNVWLGVSVEDQRRAEERIPLLLQTPAAVRFLSCEPLLGEIDLTRWIGGNDETEKQRSRSLQGGLGRRIGNRQSGKNLASSESERQPLAWGNDSDSMRETARGARLGRVFPSQGDGELETNRGTSASFGVDSLQRTHSEWANGEPQERQQEGQSPRESGIGDVLRTSEAFNFHSRSSARAESFGSISWVIVGGESGPHYRTMDLGWARSLRDQCANAGVAFFYKQGSAYRSEQDTLLDGAEWHQYPETMVCGAKMRSGERCNRVAMPSGRCDLHGGQ